MGGLLYHTKGETEATKHELPSSSIFGHGSIPEPKIPGWRAHYTQPRRFKGAEGSW